MSLRAARALWRSREKFRYAKWRFYRYQSKRPRVEREELRAKWFKLYEQARDQRRAADREIAKQSGGAHTISDAGVNLVASFEGFVPHPYRDAVGVWTIGYGETRGVGPHTPNITQEHAKSMLRWRLDRDYAPAVIAANKRLRQNELDGLTSFVYNVGVGGVAKDTRVGAALRRGDVRGAANAILAWDKAGGRALPGLTRRRRAERALILR